MTSDDPRRLVTLDVDAVLFDMDGTLVDSTSVVETLWAQFATRYRVDLSVLLPYSHGRQTRDTISRFLPPGHDPDVVTADFGRRELIETSGITEIPGARRLLGELPDSRVAIVTSAPRALAEVRLAAAGLRAPGVLVSGDDVVRGKPDPEGYETAARRLGASPAHCLVIEDAEAGIRAGVAAGGRTLVVGSHRSATTRLLPRVKDLTAVSATASEGRIRLHWPGRAEHDPEREIEPTNDVRLIAADVSESR